MGEIDSDSLVPLVEAYAGNMRSIVTFLRAGGPVTCATSHGDTMLHAAAEGWQHTMVEFLIASGANPNAQNDNGDTALHVVTLSRSCPSKGLFLKHIAPEEARRQTFFQLLFYGKTEAGIVNAQGVSALHLAATNGDALAVLQLTLERPQLVDQLTAKGAPALFLAVLGGHAECARFLIASGANVNFELKNGYRICDLIRSSDNAELSGLV